MAKRVTIRDVAKHAGVSKATVSFVINADRSPVTISEKTRKKVLQAISDVNYHPNAAARALSTNQTGQIGFLLSDSTTDGWRNLHFASALAGVEEVCRNREFGLNISLYDLSNLDSFIFPKKISQRSVDGLVLVGHVKAGVVARFREFGIPCVCIGDDFETAEHIMTLCADVKGGLLRAVEYLASLGHKRISYKPDPARRSFEIGNELIEEASQNHSTSGCELSLFNIDESFGDYRDAETIVEKWITIPEDKRPTAIIANDQVVIGIVKELSKHGLSCPDDLSLISGCDNGVCDMMNPAITAIDFNMFKLAKLAVNTLIDHVADNKDLSAERSMSDFPCELRIRNSCKQLNAG